MSACSDLGIDIDQINKLRSTFPITNRLQIDPFNDLAQGLLQMAEQDPIFKVALFDSGHGANQIIARSFFVGDELFGSPKDDFILDGRILSMGDVIDFERYNLCFRFLGQETVGENTYVILQSLNNQKELLWISHLIFYHIFNQFKPRLFIMREMQKLNGSSDGKFEI